MNMRTHHRDAAFTLVEILVVVIVLGILAAFVIPNLGGESDRAKVARAQSDIATLTTAIARLRLDIGRIPAEDEGLSLLREPPTDETGEFWKGPYLTKSVPKDPWGHSYNYYSPAPNGIDEYGVESLGRDGEPGGDGMDKDINSWTNYEDDAEME